jgi:hypothetical protein
MLGDALSPPDPMTPRRHPRWPTCILLGGALGCTASTGAATGDGADAGPVGGPSGEPGSASVSLNTDTAVEHIGGADALPPHLCHVELVCPGEIPDEPKIDCSIEIDDGRGEIVYAGGAGVELRGRSSLSAPKHQYSVELRDPDGAEAPADLLGMGAESDWVLNGMYYDRALYRNALAYDLFRAMHPARYAAEARHCDLRLDGEWLGVFLLTERIKRDDDRVTIPDDDGSGASFVVKLDDSGGLHPNALGNGTWAPVSPSDPTADQLAGMRAWLSAWESAAVTDPDALAAHLDLDAWADLVLLEELFKNNDAYYLSLHLWRPPAGPIHISPWDLDLALGQPDYNNNEDPESWVLYRPPLVASLAGVEGWDARLATRWAELRAGPLDPDAIHARIDAYQHTMGPAIDDNFAVWPIDSIQFGDDGLYPVSSYAEEDARVRAWIDARLVWMDDAVGSWSAGP